MRIEIDLNVANDSDAHRWLDRILAMIEDGWHVWDTTRGPDPDAFRTTTWLTDPGRQGQRVDEMLVASIRHGAWSLAPHGRRIRITAHPRTEDDLNPEDATRLAEEPLVILVENRFSDGAFVKRVAIELANGLRSLWGRRGNPIRFDSVGGAGQMLREIESRVQMVPFRPRLVPVIDSDKKSPIGEASAESKALYRRCEQLNLPCWVLAKRASENYLPRILLDARPTSGADYRRVVEVWDDLDDDQKDFYDMKKGLAEEPTAEEEELFRPLSGDACRVLSRGFGDNVYKCWDVWRVDAKAELVRRGRGDLERGINLIRTET
ncbi:MAG: hypothetical protein OXE73_06890 [Gammaproteobacteria bacterium]|nr:hypothetical protein [Gammaproteobacteria bacterium]